MGNGPTLEVPKRPGKVRAYMSFWAKGKGALV